MLNYSINEIEGLKILALNGSLSADSIEYFTSIVKQVAERENIIINFENVILVTSAGLNALVNVSLFAKNHDKRVIILWPEKEVEEMAEVMGLYKYLIFAKSVDEARIKIKYFT